MWQKYNPNPCGRSVGDCAVRAVAKALGTDWETAFVMLAVNAFAMCDMPNSNSVWGAVLRQNGFYCDAIDDVMSFGDFAEKYNKGTYVLGTGSHTATIVDGVLYDAWDSSNEIPIYVWYRKDD